MAVPIATLSFTASTPCLPFARIQGFTATNRNSIGTIWEMAVPVSSLSFTASIPCPPFYRTHSSATAQRNSVGTIRAIKVEKPLEDLYNVKVEREVSKERLEELGVHRWSIWKTGKCKFPWDWHVDQLIYIEEGEVRVVPEGSERFMRFAAGDLVRYPKWFEADLFFNGPYRERYSFRAYGDD